MSASMLTVDSASACITAAVVAPFTAAIDEAIIRSTAGDNLLVALRVKLAALVADPSTFLGSTSFRWMWLLYATTYGVSNMLKSLEESFDLDFGFASTVVVTGVSMVVTLLKEAAFVRAYGAKANKDGRVHMPFASYAMWFVRDLIAFTFILNFPPMLHQHLQPAAKIAAPIIASYFTTPAHLLAIAFSTVPHATFREQVASVFTQMDLAMISARQLRNVPPYSIGVFLNSKLLREGKMFIGG